jgi:Flp pilus assembly protein TadG
MSLPLLVILIPVLFGLMGFAIDLGRLYLIRGELNQAANAMAIAAAQNLNGTEAAEENAALAMNASIDQTLGDGNSYNFGMDAINGTSNGNLNNTIAAPVFFSDMSDAVTAGSANYASDSSTARYVQVNIQADAPLLWWSLLSLGQTQKTTIGATATAGISAPLCTVCGMEDFAVADLSLGNDPIDFGFVFNTKYTFYFDCTGATGSVVLLDDSTSPVPYVLIDRYNPNAAVPDETEQLFRIGNGGLPGLPTTGGNATNNIPFSCFMVDGSGGDVEYLWGNAGNGGTSTVPGACTGPNSSTVNPQVEDMLCGLYGRFADPNALTTSSGASICVGVTDLIDIATAYSTDTDLNDYDDYTLYGGNGRRVITVPVVDSLATSASGTMGVLGFRQFLVTPFADTNSSYIDPSDAHGRFAAIYIGNVTPVKQGYYNSLGTSPLAPSSCAITSGPGKVVLNQ